MTVADVAQCRSCSVTLGAAFRLEGLCADCDRTLPLMTGEARAAIELAELLWDPVYYGINVPYGDGAPVLLIPGFLASDAYLTPLQGWLQRIGYDVHNSTIPRNVGCPDRIGRRVEARAERLVARSNRRLTIVGHSKGGLLGRGLAARRPELVHHVISLGSPFRGPLDIHPITAALVDAVRGMEPRVRGRLSSCYTPECHCGFVQSFSAAPPKGVRYTSIYTRSDGVVRWTRCIDDVDENNIEVRGSHCGLAFNASVYAHLARLLAAYPSPAV